MKVGHVTERGDSSVAPAFLDGEDLERSGIDLGNPGRLQLMAQLSEGEKVEALSSPELDFCCLRSFCGCSELPPHSGRQRRNLRAQLDRTRAALAAAFTHFLCLGDGCCQLLLMRVCVCVLPAHRSRPPDASCSPTGSADEWRHRYRSNGRRLRSVQPPPPL